jgi:ankyrin repeat protein
MQHILQDDSHIIHVFNEHGVNAMHLASRFGREMLLKILLDICANGHVELLNIILKIPELIVNQSDNLNLWLSVAAKMYEMVKRLIADERVEVNTVMQASGFTVLHHTLMENDLELLELLLAEERVDPDVMGDDELALTITNHVETVEFPLRHEIIDPNKLG